MMPAMRRLTFFLLILLLTGCRAAADVTPTSTVGVEPTLAPTSTPEATASPTAVSTSTPDPTPTAPPQPELQYVINAALDYAARRVVVSETILFPNPADQALDEVVLVVQPNRQADVFTLDGVTWADGSAVTDYRLDGIRLTIPLPEPLEVGAVGKLYLEYSLALPPNEAREDFGPTPFGYTLRQINLVDWYPFLPPYDEADGWVVHNPWYYGENLVYPVADFEVSLQLLNAPAATLIAASAPDHGEEGAHLYRLENGRNFVFSISASYVMMEQQVGGTLVRGYFFPQQQTAGQAAFEATVEALQLFNDLFGVYPQPALTMVEADFMHGMEYQGLFFLSRGFFDTYEGKVGSFLVSIAAHETAHQWWYGLVGNDQALEPWLDEALSTYSERLFYERLHPDALEWWWFARINYYKPTGWVDSVLHYTAGYRPYRDAVYLNGARFLEDLRLSIGDEDFFAFLRDYAATYRDRIATGEGFFALLREHTTMDLSALLRKYFQNPL